VSKQLFSALAITEVLAMLASYIVAMTIVPLFCAALVKPHQHGIPRQGWGHFHFAFNAGFLKLLSGYDRVLGAGLRRPKIVAGCLVIVFLASLGLAPHLGMAFFPGQTRDSLSSISRRRPART